ncbi:sensor histidine kinase [Colwelliaceae bacterium 6441]
MNKITTKERRLIASNMIPMTCALLIVAHSHFLSLNLSLLTDYIVVIFTSLLACFPLVFAHIFGQKSKGSKGALIWGLGYVVYPLLLVFMNTITPNIIRNVTLSVDDYLVFLFISIFAKLPPFLSFNNVFKKRFTLLKLNFVHTSMLIALTIWVLLMTMGTTTGDALKFANDTIVIHFNFELIDYTRFITVLLQLVLVASIIWLLYWANHRILINNILTNYGVFTYCCAAIIFFIIATPAAFTVIFFLPVSQQDLLLLPKNTGGLFQQENYIFTFWLTALTTPVILAFNQHHREREMAQLAQQNTKAELTLLQQQINPHFLFNALNNIYAKVITKSDDAPVLIDHLASLLRHSVYQGQKSLVSLADEMSYLTNFIELQRIRTRDNLQLNVDIAPANWRDYNIAPLLLIVPVENAFKHSVEKSLEHCEITIHCELNRSEFSLVCENSLPAAIQSNLADADGGVGMSNLIKRLALIYPDKHTLTYGPVNNKWRVSLKIELT